MTTQLARLVHRGFVTEFGPRRLTDVDRYLRAIERRLEKLAAQPARDLESMRRVHRLEDEYTDAMTQLPPERRAAAAELVWMLEELRVSVFAQTLGTASPVSESRIRKELARVTAPAGRASGR
jgi:ATP-dependent helicase HrpA